MSNRDALRKLSRKLPAAPEIENIMDSLRDGSDMSVAITATSIVEASLERLLTKKFKIKNKRLVGQIFHNRGPLSEFYSKILIANAFGIITSNMANELNSLRAIRNTFAHAKMPLTFSHELIEKEIDSLRSWSAIQKSAIELEAEFKIEVDNKRTFLIVTKILLILLSFFEKHQGTADEALADALMEKQPPTST